MKHLSRSKIEYLINPDGTKGYVWNFYTGCLHKEKGICPVPNCWARDMDKRFGKGDFKPRLRQDRLCPRFPEKPSRIGVCFTGDLFGDWVDIDELVVIRNAGRIILEAGLSDAINDIIIKHPQHSFLFLTKAPWNYKRWGEFPENVWLGASTWNTRSTIESCLRLGDAKCLNRWLSIEPCLASVNLPSELIEVCNISWVVIGAQTHPQVLPRIEWVLEIVKACNRAHVPVFLKENLKPLFKVGMLGYDMDIFWRISEDGKTRSLRQELPG